MGGHFSAIFRYYVYISKCIVAPTSSAAASEVLMTDCRPVLVLGISLMFSEDSLNLSGEK